MGSICQKDNNVIQDSNYSEQQPPPPQGQTNVSQVNVSQIKEQKQKLISQEVGVFVSAFNPKKIDQQQLDEQLQEQQLQIQRTQEEQQQRKKIEEEQKQKIKKEREEREEASKRIINGQFSSAEFMKTGGGATYQGEYYLYHQKEIPHGQGQIKYQGRNYTIDGRFLHGKLLTISKLIFKDNSTYEGEFENEVPHGQGTHKAADGSWYYTGMFKNGFKHGNGTMKLDGKRFEGDFKMSKVTGKFKVTDLDTKVTYEGDLVDMIKHGQGVIRDSRGKIISKGEFYNGYFQKK